MQTKKHMHIQGAKLFAVVFYLIDNLFLFYRSLARRFLVLPFCVVSLSISSFFVVFLSFVVCLFVFYRSLESLLLVCLIRLFAFAPDPSKSGCSATCWQLITTNSAMSIMLIMKTMLMLMMTNRLARVCHGFEQEELLHLAQFRRLLPRPLPLSHVHLHHHCHR